TRPLPDRDGFLHCFHQPGPFIAEVRDIDPATLSSNAGELDNLLCGCQAHYIRDLFFLSSFMTTVLPDQRETCCYAWHGTRPSHLLGMRPSLRHKAPGSLSQASNRQEFFSPGSACRRVVPWGDVSSWVKGAE